jgi:hypothetical protein
MPLKQRLAAHYRAAAARGRRLLTGATTPWLKERLGAEIGRHEQIAEEIERGAEPDANSASHRTRPPHFQAKPPADNPGARPDPFLGHRALWSKRGRLL